MIYGLILAGGKGSRLYPLSRMKRPKQFLDVINEKSFLANTVERITPLIEKDNIYVVTNKDYEDQIKEELVDINLENIITEPMNKETATCIGLSAVRLLKKDQDAVMIVLPSDHYIEDQDEYVNTLAQAIEVANRRKYIVTLGIEPTRPEIGYGYIEMGERISGDIATYKVARFTEKPNLDVAKEFIFTGNYLWNSGMFVFRADVILREIEKYLPNVHEALMEIYRHLGEEDQDEVIFKQYERINGISIDFGVMQRTRKACVIKCSFHWDDIGSFTALSRFLDKNESNYISKNSYLEDCENCAVFGDKDLVIGLGVKDLVIVDAGDVLLIMDKKRDQEIKHLLTKLESEERYRKYL